MAGGSRRTSANSYLVENTIDLQLRAGFVCETLSCFVAFRHKLLITIKIYKY